MGVVELASETILGDKIHLSFACRKERKGTGSPGSTMELLQFNDAQKQGRHFLEQISRRFWYIQPNFFFLEIYVKINLQHPLKDTSQDVSKFGEQT